MFDDARSKKVILVSHCILNQNSISDGTADYSATFEEVVNCLVKNNVGIIQLPCPELMCLGLDRGDVKGSENPVIVENTRIRKELLKDNQKEQLKTLVNSTVFQIEQYLKNDFHIHGVIGINRSPSCGIDTTSDNNEEVRGKGVFMDALKSELLHKGIELDMIGIKTSNPDDAVSRVKSLF